MLSRSHRYGLLTLVLATLVGMPALAAAQTSHPSDSAPAIAEEASKPAPSVPRYLLMGGNGRSVTNEDFHGRFQLIAFGYTGCPDVCPTTLLEMQQVLSGLGARAKRLQPIFITIDPQRDTANVLDAYTRNFDARILGLTGSAELVRRAADNFKVRFEKVQEPGAAPNVYTMDHSVGMFLLGPDGELLGKFAYSTPAKTIVTRIKHWFEVVGK